MELLLKRTYFKEGTNGALFTAGRFICMTIELPWRNNKAFVSCIPEGRYELLPRCSDAFQHHFMVKNVRERSLILVHPANYAQRELSGCIAPVMQLSGIGRGLYSRRALDALRFVIEPALAAHERIFLTFKSSSYDTYRTVSKTDS